MFFCQGLMTGFYDGALPFVLIQNKATFAQLGMLSFATYPWTFKFLSAPFFDSYYFKNFGKRKTYIVPLQFISAIVIFSTCNYLNQWI